MANVELEPKQMAHWLIDDFGKCAGSYMNQLVFGIAQRSAKLHVSLLLKQLADNSTNLHSMRYWEVVLVEIQNYKYSE